MDKEKWVLFERGASIRRATDHYFKKVGIKPEKALESNDTYFVKLMVEHGLGISLMPAWTVQDEVATGNLSKLRIPDHKLVRSVSMVSLKGRKSRAITAFLDFILERKSRLQIAASS